MPDIVILRFDAPMVSFGGVLVDAHGITREFPSCSMLTGLLGNALGMDHRDADDLDALQRRLIYAVRCDVAGEILRDYQTVDLSQSFLKQGWTTRGTLQGRAGAEATRTGTHIRYRDYIANSIYTVALTLIPDGAGPDMNRIEEALRAPARPLFIGRKPCLPAAPLLAARTQGEVMREGLIDLPLTLRQVLIDFPFASRAARDGRFRIWYPAASANETGALPLTDHRDWRNQIHVGRRFYKEELFGG
jgi:CRISPR system Cascade subunit CasD